ncbi:hypothetical protein [Haloferula sp. BvORR071]|uniref:hypothetical protein n=1 Tax=Haloferula sp. BvORR071 TaxID=1396141 RepID=UPI00054FEEE0|nr:hypothetical protein [Haloferula sp. BvORR071]
MNLLRTLLPGLLVVAAQPATAGDAKSAGVTTSAAGDWEFSISAGPAWRQLGDVRVLGGYRSGGLAIPSLVGGDSLVTPPIGDPGTYGDRTYNDGYVRQDAGTPADGYTWNWGYDRADQLQGNQLAFAATGAQSIYSENRSALGAGPIPSSELEGLAPHLQFDAVSPHRLGPFRVGFSAGLDYMSADRNLAFSGFSMTQLRQDYRLDYVDRYDVSGVLVPQAPYQGTSGGPGPTIGNLPSSREMTPVLIGSESAVFSNTVFSSLELNALNITLGPSLTLSQGDFDFAVSAGFSLNVYDWEARQDERLDVTTAGGTTAYARWLDQDDGVKFRPGVYLQGDASYRLTDLIGVTGFARLDAAKDFTVGAGPTHYEVDPSGVTIGMMLRYRLP